MTDKSHQNRQGLALWSNTDTFKSEVPILVLCRYILLIMDLHNGRLLGGGRVIKGFPWGLDVQRRNTVPPVKSGIWLAEQVIVKGWGLGELYHHSPGSWKTNSSPLKGCGYVWQGCWVSYLRCTWEGCPMLPMYNVVWLAFADCPIVSHVSHCVILLTHSISPEICI